MPTNALDFQLPEFLASPAMRAMAWSITAFVLLAMLAGARRARRAAEPATLGGTVHLGSLGRTIASMVLFTGGLVAAAVALTWLAQRSDGLGAAARGTLVFAMAAAAYVAGLFIARQMTAPPWWRLNAWDGAGAGMQSRFGVRSAMRWIADDVVELLASLRPLDRALVVGGGPIVFLNVMLQVGVERTLIAAHATLFVMYVALVVALLTANRIPRVLLMRLQDLRTVARRIATGDLTARVSYLETAEYAELGELVTDINSMARSLQAREEEKAVLTAQLNHALHYEKERASTDQLTNLRNHRYFQEALAAELYRCSRTGETTTIAVLDLDDFKAVNDMYGHQEGDAVLVRTANALQEILRPYDLPARLGGEEFGVIFPSTAPEEAKLVMDRIMAVLATAGPNGTPQTFSGGIATYPTDSTEQAELFQLADSASYVAKMNGKAHTVVFDPKIVDNVAENDRINTRERDAQMRAARTLVQTVDLIEGESNEHSENVGRISAKLATSLGYDDSFAQQMYLAGLLHDVGKLGIDQAVVTKASELTADEYEQVKRHPDLSAQIVKNAGLPEIAEWVRYHHEHYDGTGYPRGLSGEDIPLGGRIVSVAEAFDVMLSDRAYRSAMTSYEAVAELQRGAGTRFDPDVVAHLVHLVQTQEILPSGTARPMPGGIDRRAA